jgi:hypothetical protein
VKFADASSAKGNRALALAWLVLACNSQTLDAGSSHRPGRTPDAGTTLDAGSTPDSGSTPADAGSVPAAGAPPDSGAAPAGTAGDTGAAGEAGTTPDAGTPADASTDVPLGLLPVDQRNPVIVSNDGIGNWQGLYTVLFPNSGGPPLAGIVVNASSYAPDLTQNLGDWQDLVSAARASGLRGIPDPIGSNGDPLGRPADGNIDETVANGSDGAHLILDVSSKLSLPNRPVVVVAGGRLTDIADAYLLDPTVTDRVVVVAALGSGSAKGGAMGAPNGELDPWADWIVAQRFRYIQVSAFYNSTADLSSADLPKLPLNPLGDLIAAQQPNILSAPTRSDQVSILAVALPAFVVTVQGVAADSASAPASNATAGPKLVPNTNGDAWLVTGIDATAARTRLQQMLEDPKTFGQ